MRFVVAPDSFKECMTASVAAQIMKKAIVEVIPSAEIELLPVADGGEGTLDVLTFSTNGTAYEEYVIGPLGNRVKAKYAVLGDGKTAVVEMAEASGLQLVPLSKRNPMVTTSYGTGELIKAALAHKIDRLIVTLGGSATNDGGVGMLQALGAEIVDEHHNPIGFGGGELHKMMKIDLTRMDARLKSVKIEVACDVTNPFVGLNGASAVFGPQKGATADMVRQLDENLIHFANLVLKQTGKNMIHNSGSGAAGGLGGALLLCNGQLMSGIDIVLDTLSFDETIKDADYILTGEGKIDSQTPNGKVIAGIAKRAKKVGLPVIALAGSVQPGYEELYDVGLQSVHSITCTPCTLHEALQNGQENLHQTVVNIIRLLKRG